MAQHETARRHRHGHRRQHRRQQADQRQEAVGAVQRGAHFRAAIFQRLDPHALDIVLSDLRLQPLFIRGSAGCRAGIRCGHQQAIGHPRPRLHQIGGRQVFQRQHHARREIEEGGTTVRLRRDQLRHRELLVAQLDLAAH